MLDLILKDITDRYVRENFWRIDKFVKRLIFANENFKILVVDIASANTKFSLKHGFTFIPQDIFVTSVEGNFNFYFRYQEFDRDNIYITTAGPVRIKFIVGLFDTKIVDGPGGAYPLVPPA